MDFKGIAPILAQFENEDTKIEVLDKLLAHRLQVFSVHETVVEGNTEDVKPKKKRKNAFTGRIASSNTATKVPPPTPSISDNEESVMLKSLKKDASAYVSQYHSSLRDTTTKEFLRTFAMVAGISNPDVHCKMAAQNALIEIQNMGETSLELIARYCSERLWSDERFEEVRKVMVDKLGYVKCIELDIEKNGFTTDVWERHVLRNLCTHLETDFLDWKAAKEAFALQWNHTSAQLKRAYGSDTYSDWTKPLIQLDIRVLDLVIFNTKLRSKFAENKHFQRSYLTNYTYVGKPSDLEIELSRELKKLTAKEEKEVCQQEIATLFSTEYHYIPKRKLSSYGTLHDARSLPLWNQRKTPSFISKYLSVYTKPYQDFRQAVVNSLANTLQSK